MNRMFKLSVNVTHRVTEATVEDLMSKQKGKVSVWPYVSNKLSHNREPDYVDEGNGVVSSLRSWRCAACRLQLFIKRFLLVLFFPQTE